MSIFRAARFQQLGIIQLSRILKNVPEKSHFLKMMSMAVTDYYSKNYYELNDVSIGRIESARIETPVVLNGHLVLLEHVLRV